MTRGRKRLTPAKKIGPDFVTRTPPDIAADQAALIHMEQAVLDHSEVLIRTGRIQAHDFSQKLHRVAAAKEFITIRESCGFKGLPYKDKEGNMRRVADADEYCQVFLGRDAGFVETVPGMDDRWRLGPKLIQIALSHTSALDRAGGKVSEIKQRYSREYR